jgi:ribonuclease P protein component
MINHQFAFPKQEHLHSKAQISDLFGKGESLISYPIRVVWNVVPSGKGCPINIVLSVSKKKLKHAVDRNRVKRLLSEAYRLNKTSLQQMAISKGISIHIAFVWLSLEESSFLQIEKKMKIAFSKIEASLLKLEPIDF